MSKGSKSANYVVVHYPRNLVDHRCVQPESFYVLFYREEKAQEAALRSYHIWYDDPIDVRLPDGSYLTLVLENKVLVSPEATLGDVVKQVQTYKTPEGLLFSSTTPCPISILPQKCSRACPLWTGRWVCPWVDKNSNRGGSVLDTRLSVVIV